MLTLARLGLGLACAAVVIFSSSTEPAAQGPGDDPYVKIRVPLQLKKMITPNKAFVSCNLLRQDNKSAGSAYQIGCHRKRGTRSGCRAQYQVDDG